ncbi:MAG: hypothetical protein RL219_1167 [Actinomycetota bacterium]
MTYDDVVAAFFVPAAEPIPEPVVPATVARRLRDALEPIATHGWWSRPPMERLAGLGLGFFDAYVWGRAAALGTPSASVVVATFGVFEPGLLTAVYEQGVAAASRDDVLHARALGASESLGQYVTDAEAAPLADALLAAIDGLDPMGRPLFAALRSLPRPETPAGRLWRAAELVREHRGDVHLAAGVSWGLDAVEMNVFTELWLGYPLGEYSGTRGFAPERIAAASASLGERGWARDGMLTESGRAARERLEAVTDEGQAGLVRSLGSQLEELVESCARISERLVAAPAFPADPRKRAAG